MSLHYTVPTALEYFAALVTPRDAAVPLLETAACIAQIEHPQLDVQQVLADVDALQARLARRLPHDAGALQRLRALNHFFYGELAFAGNPNDYYAPGNSYLHTVLHTRRGIPISLAVLWLELAQGLGLNAAGVSFPGHFLVKVRVAGGQVVLDPLTGQSLSQDALIERLALLHGQPASGAAAPSLTLYLQPATARDIVARMLRNLKEVFRAADDWLLLLQVQQRLVLLLPEAWAEWRDKGLAHAQLDEAQQAMADLQLYLDNAHGAADTAAVAELLRVLRQR